MSDQNLPDLNESNPMINAQSETAFNQITPPCAIINGDLSVTNYVAVGPFAIGPAQGVIEATGSVASFSFVRRNLTSWPAQLAAGNRFVWYSPDGTARLYTDVKGDLLTVTAPGNVGIGTTDPLSMLHIGDGLFLGTGGYRPWMVRGTQVSWDSDNVFFGLKDEGSDRKDAVIAWGDNKAEGARDVFRFIFVENEGPVDGQEIMRLEANGTVGDVRVTGNVYANGILLTSSRELKENISELSGSEAVEALKNLSPVKFNFKADSDKNLHIGFIAEDVPNLVATSDKKTLSPMDIVAVLTQALKEQQNTISALAEKVKLLEAKTA
jgi:hypothetical protein